MNEEIFSQSKPERKYRGKTKEENFVVNRENIFEAKRIAREVISLEIADRLVKLFDVWRLELARVLIL